MEHREYRRIVDGADTAVLFIHGIVGTPNHFAPFLPLVPEHVSILNLLLDGHGGGVKDFSRTSMKRWEVQVAQVVDELSRTHRRIFITAHSMGTLLAIEQAVKHPNITALLLLAAPLRVRVKAKMAVTSWRLCFDRVTPGDKTAEAAKRCSGVHMSKNLFLYLGWIPRYLELFAKIRQTRALLSQLSTPCTAFQSAEDELVSPRASSCLQICHSVKVNELEHSGHFYYSEGDLARIQDAFRDMLR